MEGEQTNHKKITSLALPKLNTKWYSLFLLHNMPIKIKSGRIETNNKQEKERELLSNKKFLNQLSQQKK